MDAMSNVQTKAVAAVSHLLFASFKAADALSVVIGDSITDLEAAKLADIVIARDFLIEKCEELHIPYEPFESFHDVINIIDAKLGVEI